MINAQVHDEAAEWFVMLRFEKVDGAVQERFMDWLRTSPEHVRAYLGVVTLWTDLPSADLQRAWGAAELVALAQDAMNVIPLEQRSALPLDAPSGLPGSLSRMSLLPSASQDIERSARQGHGAVGRPLRLRNLAIAASLLVMCVAGALAWVSVYRVPTYATDVGEQRTFRLSDGSTVQMNSRSKLRVRFSEHERAVDLLEGQVLFHVAKDPQRAFLVRSDTARVRAVGTQFDVYRSKSGTVVTVVEGRVAVFNAKRSGVPAVPQSGSARPGQSGSSAAGSSSGAGGREVLLSSGEQLTVTAQRMTAARHANAAAATAWTQGTLTFTSAPLSSVVEEFNRYNVRPIVLGSSMEDFPVTAVFSTTDHRALIEFLKTQPDVVVTTDATAIRISSSAAQAAK